MKLRVRLAVLAAAGSAVVVAMAVPAQAIPSGTLSNPSGTVIVTYSGFVSFAYLNMCPGVGYPAGTCQAVAARIYFATNDGSSTLGASPFTIQEGSTVKVGSAGTSTAALPAGTYRMDLWDSTGGGVLIDSIVATISSAEGSATSSTPAPVIQQFGKPASGNCDSAAPVTFNWGGASSGGWGESWAEWMHGGTGGFVCTRTLIYSNNLGAWTVG